MPRPRTTISTLRRRHAPHIGAADCDLIIAHVLQTDRVTVLTHTHRIVSPRDARRITTLCRRRADDVPLAYLTGAKEFHGRNFAVTRATLVPRPETECLVDYVCDAVRDVGDAARCAVVDIGTGSGAIIVTIARLCASARRHISFFATDIDKSALRVARRNSRAYPSVPAPLFFHSDLLANTALLRRLRAVRPTHVFLVANLPYVDIAKRHAVCAAPEGRALRHEPPHALWARDGGLHHYNRLIVQTRAIHATLPNTQILSFYEIDPAQQTPLTRHLAPTRPTFLPDLSGRARFCRWDIAAML